MPHNTSYDESESMLKRLNCREHSSLEKEVLNLAESTKAAENLRAFHFMKATKHISFSRMLRILGAY